MELPELAGKIIFCLLLAGLLGWIIGFLLGRIFGSANATELLNECEGRMRVRDQELGGLRSDLTTASARVSSLETELTTLATTLKTRDNWVSEFEGKTKELQADLDARISELDELKAESDQIQSDLRAQLETSRIASGKELDALRVRVAAASVSALEPLGTQPHQRDGEIARLRLRLSELEPLVIEVQQREAKVRALNAQLQSREAEVARLKVRFTEMELMMREVKEPVVKVSQASSLPPVSKDRDDLKKIFGIGPVLENLLHTHGIYWFRQTAEWTPEDVQHYDHLLEDFRGRIVRDDWITGAQQEQQKKYGDQL